MEKNSIRSKLLAMSDMELYSLLNTVALASGLDASKAQALTSDIPRLRRMLSSLTDGQIDTLLASLGRGTDINRIIEGL